MTRLLTIAAASLALLSPVAVDSTSAVHESAMAIQTAAASTTTSNSTTGPADCLRFKDEPWASGVEYLCGLMHDGAYDFYYKLTGGKFMRNCYCSNLKTGTVGGPLAIQHYTQKENDLSVCLSNSKKDDFGQIYKLFESVGKCPEPGSS